MKGEKQNIKAMLIFEILGKPQQYLVTALENMISQIENEGRVKIISRDIKPPKKKEDLKDDSGEEFYTTFAEVEIESPDIPSLIDLMFDYMPAHVDIISPEQISLQNSDWSDVLTKLIRKLHAYDEIARILQVEKENLNKQLSSLWDRLQSQNKKDPVNAASSKKQEPEKRTSDDKGQEGKND